MAQLLPTLASAGSFLSTAAPIIGAVGTLVGGVQQASAYEQQAEYDAAGYRYQANIAAQNAIQAEEAALKEQSAASREAAERYRQLKLAQSNALAKAAASGGGVDGDILRQLAEFDELAEYEGLNALYEGRSRADGYLKRADAYRADAGNYEYQADVSKAVGKQKKSSTLLSTGTGLIGQLPGVIDAGKELLK